MKIIYGTTNKNKIEEMQKYFNHYDIELISLKDIGFNEEIIENGLTFKENSMIKAWSIKKFCKINNFTYPILTDDAGICIKSLNNRPGVYTARYAGDHAPQEVVVDKILKELDGITDRSATFYCALTFIYNDEIIEVEGKCEGKIANERGKMGGFTYGPLFIPNGYDRPYNELSFYKSHRYDAMQKLLKELITKKIINS